MNFRSGILASPLAFRTVVSSMKRALTGSKRGALAGPETLTGPTYDVLAGRRVQLYYYYLWGQGALC